MARQYEYRARDSRGQIQTGTILAENETAVAVFIRNKGYYVTKIKESQNRESLSVMLQNMQTVSTKDLAVMCRQFSTMLEAGLPMLSCLNVMVEQTENPRLKDCLKDAYKAVQEGSSLAKALHAHPRVFPDIMIAMIEAGEVGGVMDTIMNRLAVHFEKEHRLNEKVKSAMTYPAVVVSLAFIIVGFIVTFVLPTFLKLFENLKTELPWSTRVLLWVSSLIQNYWWLLIPTMILGVLGVGVVFRRPDARLWLDGVLLHMPVFGSLWRKIAITRFSRTLSTLVRGGVPIIAALEVVKRTTGNLKMTQALTASQESIREGKDLSTRLASSGLFPPMVVQMVAVGEESGQLDNMLDKIADFYDAEVEDLVGRLSSLIEPIMIVVLGAIVGFVIVSIMIPIFDVITNFDKVAK